MKIIQPKIVSKIENKVNIALYLIFYKKSKSVQYNKIQDRYVILKNILIIKCDCL